LVDTDSKQKLFSKVNECEKNVQKSENLNKQLGIIKLLVLQENHRITITVNTMILSVSRDF